jgi:ATP-binding cassette, subfamily C, bacterial PrsD
MNNILMLTGALFMLYDRLLPSRSVPSLVALLILAAGLYAVQGIIDAIRSRILVRIDRSLDEAMSLRVYDAIVRLPLKLGAKSEGVQPIRDLDTVRGFRRRAGRPVRSALDASLSRRLFFIPHYIGLTALAGAIVLVTLTVVTEVRPRRPTRSATQFAVAVTPVWKLAAVMPRRSPPWAWAAALRGAGTISTAIM